MYLRSGKKILSVGVVEEPLSVSLAALTRTMYNLSDIRHSYNDEWFINRVGQTTEILNYILDRADDLKNMDSQWLTTVYLKAIGIQCSIIEHSYRNENYMRKNTKQAFILILSSAYKVQMEVGTILWTTRQEPHIRELLETDNGDMMYRCLKHIISDESEPHDYEIYTYDDGEYSGEEIWDYYFGHNAGAEYDDPYITNADICLDDIIRHRNRMLSF